MVALTNMFPQSFTKNTGLPFYNYDQRGLLRNLTAQNGNQVLVDGLGMFVFYAGDPIQQTRINATTPFVDDDESCFLAQGGAWVLEYPHWDLINGWNAPDTEVLNAAVFSRLNGRQRVFNAVTVINTITSISGTSTASLVVNIPGASIGDSVVINPSAVMLASSAGRLSCYGFVSSIDSVTIVLVNSAASAPTPVADLSFQVTVIKQS